MKILRNTLGCDFVLSFPLEYKNRKIKLLQLTDTQIIDAEQRRTPYRLRIDEIAAWSPNRFDENCGNHIRALVATVLPDLIFITGDLVYGSFDDNGTSFERFCNFMDTLKIPWAPVFGNHDNESARGVDWQCAVLKKSKNCIFKRGRVTGNSNYTIGIAVEGELVRVMYMLDSNGAKDAADPSVKKEKGIYRDQLDWIVTSAEQIDAIAGKGVPSFMAFHFPTTEFVEAEIANGYRTQSRTRYTIGVDVEAKNGDFGCNYGLYADVAMSVEGFKQVLRKANTDGIFVGHCHAINTVITHDGIRYVYGLKTGQYDYHIPYHLGGTLVTVERGRFEVAHVPALVRCFGLPGKSKIFNDFYV